MRWSLERGYVPRSETSLLTAPICSKSDRPLAVKDICLLRPSEGLEEVVMYFLLPRLASTREIVLGASDRACANAPGVNVSFVERTVSIKLDVPSTGRE